MNYFVKRCMALLWVLILVSPLFARAEIDEGAGTEKWDRSYAYGLIIGSDLKSTGLEFDFYAISRGLRDAVEGRDPHLTLDEAISLVQQSYMAVMEQQIEENRLQELQFLEENGKRSGVVTTGSGLQYEVLSAAGGGKQPNYQSVVRVNYEGTLVDGTVFDSSYSRGEPEEIPLNAVIPGWSEGLCLMGVGDVYTLYIPSQLAYGRDGTGQIIPPYTPLIFKVELLEILEPEENQD
ncbi:MAG: FKBP-type peptidyl-prolyl cis-trans isomerase [Treponema sp.]|nr:FKBP-type peptidyl-prolyl cis-trans isomerase [Treponema sp.]